MGFRRSGVVVLAVVAGAAMAAIAEGQGPASGTAGSGTATGTTVTASPPGATPESPGSATVPSSERTHPQMHPNQGGRLTDFTLTFTLRDAPGHQGAFAAEYRVQVTPPPGSAASCTSTQPPAINSGAAGEVERVTLPPPAQGWCTGTYRLTVYLQRGPYCPPPTEGQPPTPCPEFATQELDTGTASFTVGDGSPGRNARIVGEVKACNAPGHCLKRAFDVSAIDSAENVVAEASTVGANNRYRLRVPAGHYSLLAKTSNGLNCNGSAVAQAHRTVIANITCLVP